MPVDAVDAVILVVVSRQNRLADDLLLRLGSRRRLVAACLLCQKWSARLAFVQRGRWGG